MKTEQNSEMTEPKLEPKSVNFGLATDFLYTTIKKAKKADIRKNKTKKINRLQKLLSTNNREHPSSVLISMEQRHFVGTKLCCIGYVILW